MSAATANGQEEAMREAEERQEERAHHQQNINNAMAEAREIRQELIAELDKTDLSEGSKNLLRNLVSRDFILANLTRAQVHEFKWRLKFKYERYKAMHPHSGCLVTGSDRAAINDDPTDKLTPLSQREHVIVDDFFDGVWFRVTRSENFRQQEILQTTISESIVNRDQQETSSGGLLDRFK